jgi:serine/threonine-protein kinase RsbW
MRAGKIRLTIDSRLDQVHLIGLALKGICAAIPLTEANAYETELCAYAGEAGHEVEVDFSVENGALTVEVRDQGQPMDWEAVHRRRERASLLDEGGRGLLIMEAYMDRVSYGQSGGKNVLTLVKGIHAEAHA